MAETLIERLEKATEGSSELDARIHHALFPNQSVLLDAGHVGQGERREPRYGTLADYPIDGWSDWEAVAATFHALPYTTSIDAALSLYSKVPAMVPSNPLKACIEALKSRND